MHPIGNQYRAHNASHTRIAHITKNCGGGMASGGAAPSGKRIHKSVQQSAMRADGGKVVARADRPARARGGRLGKKSKGHTLNVIVAPSAPKAPDAHAAIPGVAAGLPPGPALPPRPPMPPMGAGPMPPPGAVPPPGMPPRYAGGRAYKRGGKVNADTAGIGVGRTPVQHSPNKQDGKNIGRKDVITKATGGPITSKYGFRSGMAPHAKGGAGGGLAKLDKAHHPEKYRV